MRVIGSVFSGRGQDGDFSWMIEQDQYKDALFIFNDNEGQYKEHRDNPSDPTGCAPGGGNAIIRPYQCRTPPRAAGIPTGPDYDRLTQKVKDVIDDAISTIKRVATQEDYKRIFYSAANTNGALGTGIFQVGDDVKSYIVNSLKSLE